MRKTYSIAVLTAGALALVACGSEAPSEDGPAAGGGEAEPAAQLTFAELTGDPVAGERAYAKCQVCHRLEKGAIAVGPSLHGIVGRPAGSVAGFDYSDANASADIVWTGENLFAYLEDPRGFMPGNRMAFSGIADAQERADLIAFLETHSE